ncbi:MAG: hypothetical protein HUU50_09000 [Candidatus Brocadiae bacterium]|nr:hypothetical protein [Candidatus Brocadiia bacterium]
MDVNYGTGEVNLKVVFYGPGLSGKTTNLEIIHSKVAVNNRGRLTAIATQQDRTLFFDFMPLDLGKVGGLKTKLRLFTVPGQVYYNSTRKLVLQRVDGVVFVADSQIDKRAENIEAMDNLDLNLKENGIDINTLPLVLQYNKRDLPDIMNIEDMNADLNFRFNAPVFPAIAITGEGVFPTLKTITGMVLKSVEDLTKPSTKSIKSPSTGSLPSLLKKKLDQPEMEGMNQKTGTARIPSITEKLPVTDKSNSLPGMTQKPSGSTTRIFNTDRPVGSTTRISPALSTNDANKTASTLSSSSRPAQTPSAIGKSNEKGSNTVRVKPLLGQQQAPQEEKENKPSIGETQKRKPLPLGFDANSWNFEGDPYTIEEDEEI